MDKEYIWKANETINYKYKQSLSRCEFSHDCILHKRDFSYCKTVDINIIFTVYILLEIVFQNTMTKYKGSVITIPKCFRKKYILYSASTAATGLMDCCEF